MTATNNQPTSPLIHLFREQDVRLTDFAGWQMPLRFTSELEEHQAVRSAAGLFDLSHMGQLEVIGPQAAEALDYCFVNRASALATGAARYSLLVTDTGGILDDLLIYRLSDSEFLVVPNAANRIKVVDELTRRTSSFDVSITDHTTSRGMLALQGPNSQKVLQTFVDIDLTNLRYYRCITATFKTGQDRAPVFVARTGYTGEDGFEISAPANDTRWVWQAILSDSSVHPCGLAARDSLRLEAGMPLYGNELTTQRTPFDVGLGGLVSFRSEFVGIQALQAAKDNPHSYLIGLKGDGRRAARAGSVVYVQNQAIGEITSGILSPTLGYPIALAVVNKELPSPTRVEVDVRGRRLAMTVTALPFYARNS